MSSTPLGDPRLGVVSSDIFWHGSESKVRHIDVRSPKTHVEPLCGEWGRWARSTSAKTFKRPLCKRCLAKYQTIHDALMGERIDNTPVKGEVWHRKKSKERRQTAKVNKVTDNGVHVELLTDFGGAKVAAEMAMPVKYPLSLWLQDWVKGDGTDAF